MTQMLELTDFKAAIVTMLNEKMKRVHSEWKKGGNIREREAILKYGNSRTKNIWNKTFTGWT